MDHALNIGTTQPIFLDHLMSEGAPQRLRSERERLGHSQRAFAALSGISKNTQLAYETASSPIPLDYLVKTEAIGVDIIYVMTGTHASDFDDGGTADRREPEGDLVEVAEIDPRFGMGAAFMDEAAAPEMRTFSGSWLRQISGSPPEELYWARGRGNSMSPTIEEGELVLIDRRQQGMADADLYWAFAWGDVGAIKRLRPMPDGTIKILSDNPSTPPDVARGDEIHIFGRVVAVVKKI